MKLRTISDSARIQLVNSFTRCAYTAFVAEILYFKVTISLIFENQRYISSISTGS